MGRTWDNAGPIAGKSRAVQIKTSVRFLSGSRGSSTQFSFKPKHGSVDFWDTTER
jgi:hypothetical protein